MKQMFLSENIKESLGLALHTDFDIDAAIKRVTVRLANMPMEKLYSRKDGNYISFYVRQNGSHKYISKKTSEIYGLARRQYLSLLLDILKLIKLQRHGSDTSRKSIMEISKKLSENTAELMKLIDTFAAGNLNLPRILLTKKQYKWYYSNYRRKKLNVQNPKITADGIKTRSKSESNIGSGLEYLSVIYHYEEKLSINVYALVQKLEESLRNSGKLPSWKLNGRLLYYKNGICCWNVPEELSSMNSIGSVWRTYDEKSGCIEIYNDFKIMLADGESIIWEHEGLFDDFLYRLNSQERIGIIDYNEAVPKSNIITSFERDAETIENVKKIIVERILPRYWF